MNGKHLLATLMLLTLFAFWGCMDPSTRDNPYDKQADPIFLKKAKIAGTVVLQDDLEAPGGTQVKVFSDLYTNQVTTDEQGKFSISGITPGDYLLSIERKNFIAIREKLPLGIGEDLDIGKKSLRYKTGSLKGFVLLEDEDGFPEIDNSGVRITFIRTVNAASNSLTAALVSDSSSCTPESKTESQKQFSTTNNPDGSFSMPNLPTGKYEVELVKNSFAPNKSNKQQVDIQEGAPVTLTDLKMKKVTGVVEFARRDEDQSLKRIEVTSTRKVVLLLHSFGNPVKDVVIREQQFEKEDQINDDEWIPYQADVDYEIKSEGDGKKLVYVLYRGFACQKSKIFVASIILDTIKPQITSLGERNNREAINDKQGRVNLEIEAEDNLNMLNQIFISEDEKFTNAIGRDFDLNQTWYLNKDKSGKKISEDKKNIYVKVSDLAGNMSEIASLEIEYDITPPTFKPGFPKVVGGKIEVRTRDIEIELGALKADFFAVGDGDLSCDSLKSNALPESGKTRHILPKVDGDKELTVCIYDRAGNLHGAKLNLKLDQTSPQPDVIKPVELVDSQGKPFAKNIVAKSQLYLLLRASGADFYDIAEDFNFKNNLQSNKYGQNPLKVDYKLSSDKQGVYNLFVRYRDQAGNMSAVSDLSLFLGTPDAKPTMLIDGSNIFCRDERGIVNLSIFVGDNLAPI